MTRKILVADLLCGAGGASTGCMQALLELGWRLEDIILFCLNHWPTAIATHTLNHPHALHYVQDIAVARPHIIVPQGYLDLLIAAPTCTHHSIARGGKPTSDQQRSDPWHIITWLTELRVKCLIIENVWEFRKWGPVDPQTGKPIKSREGEYFWAWINALKALSFTNLEWRKLNAADYGDATTRYRFILMARSDGQPVHWPMPTHRKRDEVGDDLFGGAKPWRPARDIIDWSIKGKSIFKRRKPLAPKTLLRILAGATKFNWPTPLIAMLTREIERSLLFYIRWAFTQRNQPTVVKKRQQRRAMARDHIARLRAFRLTHAGAARGGHCADPMLVSLRRNGIGSDIRRPLPTITANGTHIGLAEPVIVNLKKASAPASTNTPLPTQTAAASHIGIAEPFVLSQASGGVPRAVSEPLPTIVTGGERGSGTALISPYYGSGSGETCVTVDEPLPTVTAKARFGMVVPLTHSDGSNRARDISEPLPTLTTAKRGELAFITAQHGERPGQAPRVHDLNLPTPTIAATGHVDLVEGVASDEDSYDILFRMLEVPELGAAMGFDGYQFTGTKTEQTKQVGNAVSVRKMKACVSALMADAAPKWRAPPPEFREAAE